MQKDTNTKLEQLSRKQEEDIRNIKRDLDSHKVKNGDNRTKNRNELGEEFIWCSNIPTVTVNGQVRNINFLDYQQQLPREMLDWTSGIKNMGNGKFQIFIRKDIGVD